MHLVIFKYVCLYNKYPYSFSSFLRFALFVEQMVPSFYQLVFIHDNICMLGFVIVSTLVSTLFYILTDESMLIVLTV